MTLFGTAASFEHNSAGARWVTKDRRNQVSLDEVLAVGNVRTRTTRSAASHRCIP